ncbi:hypothetical protein FB45DRAFT_140732 [Roridomyces roridus]|uniref:Transmembrane protein n=1 Tax=Roridomyces roridus TaxID=1738132 RepID=A0AAD7FI04_9AGAR|nr:hypothetical protein FB45DRAFT_140732 [Roridomyces roridus]
MAVTPSKTIRLIALFLAWAWAVVSLGIEINAFVKSHKDKRDIEDLVPSPTTVSINTNDVFRSGAVVTAGCATVIALCTLFIILLIFDRPSSLSASGRPSMATRTLPLQYLSLGFFSLWIFSAQVPVTVFVAQRSPKIVASLAGITIPASVVKTIESSLGVRTRYKDYHYLILVAVLPWFTFLFTLIAAVVSYLASTRRADTKQVEVEQKAAA